MRKLLARDEFRNAVLKRDNYKCIFCDETDGLDAHHILERRLWPDGGYYINNGATVCQKHHLECEMTIISVEDILQRLSIKDRITPPHLYQDTKYDKWGNPILNNGQRLRGELFFDESVQKVLSKGSVLNLFTHWVKYPRTFHCPWSYGRTKDDRVIEDMSSFHNKEVVVTVKLDGENTSLYYDYIHARTLEYSPRQDRDRIKALHASIAHDIPKDWRICCENIWAKHSIEYKNLDSFLYVFSIWNEKNECLSWDETKEWSEMIGLKTVKELYRGPFDQEIIQSLYKEELDGDQMEGYVIRTADGFPYSKFSKHVAKFVRANHVTTQAHWTRKIEPNPIKIK